MFVVSLEVSLAAALSLTSQFSQTMTQSVYVAYKIARTHAVNKQAIPERIDGCWQASCRQVSLQNAFHGYANC